MFGIAGSLLKYRTAHAKQTRERYGPAPCTDTVKLVKAMQSQRVFQAQFLELNRGERHSDRLIENY